MQTRFSAVAAIALLFLTFGTAACGGGGGTRILDPDPIVIPPPPPPPPPPPDPLPTLGSVTRIYAFGDSLTEGESKGQLFWGLHDHGTPGISTSYPFKLQVVLDAIYGDDKIHVYNGGRGGEKAGLSATRDRMVSEINQYDPHVVLFMHGVNDLNAGVQSGADDDEIVEDAINAVEELIEVAKVTGSPRPHLMVGSLPRQIATSKALSRHLIVPFNNSLADVAEEEKVTFVDIYKVISEALLMDDGLHITETGNQKIADTFYAAIKAKYHREPAAIR